MAPQEDPDNIQDTDNVNEDQDPETTSDEWQDPDAEMDIGAQSDSSSSTGQSRTDNNNSGGQGVSPLALNTEFPWLLVILIALAAIIALLLGIPYAVRRMRLRRIQAMPPDEQINTLYQFFVGRLKRLGIERPATMSAVDFANLYRSRIAPYAGSQEAGSFDHLTALYIANQYAGEPLDDDDLAAMHYLYDAFYENVRHEVGAVAYHTRYVAL